MKILLDTNALIWVVGTSPRLPRSWRDLLLDPDNDVFFSAVSVVEISTKASLGKLTAPDDYLPVLAQSGLTEVTLTAVHGQRMRTLPFHHRDPFDRMIIAQALVEDLAVMTSDPAFAPYGVTLV